LKNILITGGLGFIGSNFLNYFVPKNTDKNILNIDLETYASSHQATKSLSNFKNYSHLKIDISNESDINNLFNSYEFDLVLHFAAESHVDNSIKDPLKFAKSNVLGTLNLLNSFNNYKNFKNKLFYHISTDEVYGSSLKNSFDENYPYDPSSPYSASKASSDHFVKSYYKTYGLPVIISNCSNNFGPWQFKEKLIPVVIKSIINNKFIPVYGNGLNIRDWIYVDDHISAIEFLLKYGEVGESYCIGSNNELSNISLIKNICEISDKILKNNFSSFDKVKFIKDRPGHDLRYSINSKKINSLGWKPICNFDESIEKTINWYISNSNWLK
tara:strand:- start:1913 stop:2896 length:984 start_codon:yes stop_codon:yes gene_type:complete